MGRKWRTVSRALSFLVGSGDAFLQLFMLQRIHRALILGSEVTERSEVTEVRKRSGAALVSLPGPSAGGLR